MFDLTCHGYIFVEIDYEMTILTSYHILLTLYRQFIDFLSISIEVENRKKSEEQQHSEKFRKGQQEFGLS